MIQKSLQNMTNSGSERHHSNHHATKAVTCYICEKTVKEYSFSSHLYFSSLQCRDCGVKFRHCKTFNSFRKSTDGKKSDSCVHRTLKWTRDPIEYLERKLRKEIAKSKSKDYHPSTREVKKEMITYLNKLKPLEAKSPWKYAIKKLRKYVLQRYVSKSHGKTDKKYSNGIHHSEKEKHTKEDSKLKGREESQPSNEEANQNVPCTNKSEETIHEDTIITDNTEVNKNDGHSNDTTIFEEDMVPQYVEEIVISQTEWEIDVTSFNEFEECNKSVIISLGIGEEGHIPLYVEEVCITKHEETGLLSLIVEEIDCLSVLPGAEAEHEAVINEDKAETESQIYDDTAKLGEIYDNNVEIEAQIYNDTAKLGEIYDNSAETEAQIYDDKAETEAQIYDEKAELGEIYNDKAEFAAETYKDKRLIEPERIVDKETYMKKEVYFTDEEENENSFRGPYKDTKMQSIRNEKDKGQPEIHKMKKECIRQNKRGRPKRRYLEQTILKKKRSYRVKNTIYRELQRDVKEETRTSYNGEQYPQGNNILRTKKYNLRSRRHTPSNAFLQKLDAYEKKKLWEKLIPTAKMLRKLTSKGTSHESFSTLHLPINSDEADDDFLVDILLSQAFDIQQLHKMITYLSSKDHDDETAIIVNQVNKALGQFSFTKNRPFLRPAADTSKPFVSQYVKSAHKDSRTWGNVQTNSKKKSNTKRLDHITFGRDSTKRQLKTYYISPPADGNYYVVTYPSQPLLTECPMCYFRVFPAMFSLNLVTNLATTRCVGCTLTIYVVQEPDGTNSLPKIVFREGESSEDDPVIPKPARYKAVDSVKLQRRVSARNFFKK